MGVTHEHKGGPVEGMPGVEARAPAIGAGQPNGPAQEVRLRCAEGLSTLCDASPLARIAGPRMVLYRWKVVSTLLRLLNPDSTCHLRFPMRARSPMFRFRSRVLGEAAAS